MSFNYPSPQSAGSARTKVKRLGQVSSLSYSAKFKLGLVADVVVLKVSTGGQAQNEAPYVFQVVKLRYSHLQLSRQQKKKIETLEKKKNSAVALARKFPFFLLHSLFIDCML